MGWSFLKTYPSIPYTVKRTSKKISGLYVYNGIAQANENLLPRSAKQVADVLLVANRLLQCYDSVHNIESVAVTTTTSTSSTTLRHRGSKIDDKCLQKFP